MTDLMLKINNEPSFSSTQQPVPRRKQNILNRFYSFVRSSKTFQFILCLVMLFLILTLIIMFCKDQLITSLQLFSEFVHHNGISAVLLYMLLIILVCFPPLVGYSLLLTLSGYLWGTWHGFLINWFSAFIGASLCFLLTRLYFNISKVKRRPSEEKLNESQPETNHDKYLKLLNQLTIYLERNPSKSTKLILMLRLAPYPFNILNFVLAQIPAISYTKYALLTGLALVKTVLHAWLGSTLGDLEGLFMHPLHTIGSQTMDTRMIVELLMFLMAVMMAIMGAYMTYQLVQKALKEVERESEQNQEIIQMDPVVKSESSSSQ